MIRRVLVALGLAAISSTTLKAQAVSKAPDSTVVILLGTGTPVPDPHTQGPSTAVVYGDRIFLFDAGAGVMRQVSAARLNMEQIKALFLTHLHTDHTLGVPDVIFTTWVFGRSSPLRIYGPRGSVEMANHLIAAYAEDIVTRTKGPERAVPNGYRVHARDISPGIIYDSARVRIRAIAVPHNTGRPALAYRIDTPNKSIVISGDIGPSDVLIPWARNVDVLVHEVVNLAGIDGKMPGGADAKTYMQTAHTPTARLGAIAAKANPRVLVLTHIIPSGQGEAEMISSVRAGGFSGRIVFGHDLDRF